MQTDKPLPVLLELALSEADCMELMQSIFEVPVIFLFAYGHDHNIELAFERGAADYVVKPLSPMKLTARMRAALRNRSAAESFVLGDLTIDYSERHATVSGRTVELTAGVQAAL